MILHIQNIPPQYKLILKYHRRKQQVKKMTTTKNEKPCAGRFMLLLIFLFSLHLERSFAQQKNYFQQIVDYKIEVTLDDENHLLQGKISMQYTNKSPDVLDRIGMHLWPNAFSNKNTEFGKQKLLHRKTKFYDAKPDELGSIQNLRFTVNKDEVRLEYLKNKPDQAWLHLKIRCYQVIQSSLRLHLQLKFPFHSAVLGMWVRLIKLLNGILNRLSMITKAGT